MGVSENWVYPKKTLHFNSGNVMVRIEMFRQTDMLT